MTMRMTRRMAAAGALGGFTALGTLMATPLAAQTQAKDKDSRLCLTVLYPWQVDAQFDFAYYRDKHLTLLAKLYGASVGKMQVRKGLRQGDGSPPGFVATVTIDILSMEGFDAAGKQHFPTLAADLPNFSNIKPLGQIEEIMK
jgi:uncharacterized protein (TIGR02118 family)